MLGRSQSFNTTSVLSCQAGGAAGPSISFLSYLFGFGPYFSLGYLSIGVKKEALYGPNGSEARDHYYLTAGIGYGIWLAWLSEDKTQVLFRYRSLHMSLWCTDAGERGNKSSSVSLGIGYRFF